MLWCGTFQLAWNEMCELLGEDPSAEGGPPMVAILNRKSFTKDQLDEESYYAVAGIVGEGILKRIRKEMAEKFGDRAKPRLIPKPGSLPEGWWVAYAYLLKKLPFEWAFTRFDHGMRFGDTEVVSFGIYQYLEIQSDEVAMARQVAILDYRNRDDFVLELKTHSAQDRLILAKLPPLATLGETVDEVRSRVAQSVPTALGEFEDLEVPVIDFDITREYDELEHLLAVQRTQFRLDETGAVLESEGMAAGATTERSFVFDNPFLVLLERQGAEKPYFALWVANAELLVKAPPPPKSEKEPELPAEFGGFGGFGSPGGFGGQSSLPSSLDSEVSATVAAYRMFFAYELICHHRGRTGMLPLSSPTDLQDVSRVDDLTNEGIPSQIDVDPWGRPFHLALDADGDGVVTVENRKLDCGFLMWSDGPNETNDGCTGDDIWVALPL